VHYEQTLAKQLISDAGHWRDAHALWFHVDQLCVATESAADDLRMRTGGRTEFAAIVVITEDKDNTPRWKQFYGSRAAATHAVVAALGSNHAGSIHVHPTTSKLTFKQPGDGGRPNGRSRFVLLLQEPLSEEEFHALLRPLQQGQAS
jgi:hypothetical protein